MNQTIDFNKLEETCVEMLTLHQAAVSKVGSELLFDLLKKGKSTGYNEMNPAFLIDRIKFLKDAAANPPEQSAKLGVLDLMIGMATTRDFSPLVVMAAFFNMACFPVQDSDGSHKKSFLTLLQNVSRECFENTNEVAEALKDNKVSRSEAKQISKEAMDLINAAAELKQYADQIAG